LNFKERILVVDTHAHIIVPEITREFAPEETWRPRVYWEEGNQVVEFGGRQIRSTVHEFVQVEGIMEAQAAAEIDVTLLCPWVTLLRYNAEPVEGLRTCRIQNKALARLAQSYPDKIRALGCVPLQDPQLAAEELYELVKEPGLCGVEVAASVNPPREPSPVYLGDERFAPFWEAAEETGALIFIHPTTRGFEAPVFGEYYLWNAVGNPLETTITAAHMIMAGVMERHRRLKVLLAHGGGALPALRGRLNHAHSFQPQARARLNEAPEESLKRFYFDTITHDELLLRQLIEFAGADHVVVGSDYPFDMGVQNPAETVRKLQLPTEEEAKILSGNALGLIGEEF
jgi:aminocarboxymuconate-semialdehyde decarboxylase